MSEKRNKKTGRKQAAVIRPEVNVTGNRVRGKAKLGQRNLDYLKPPRFRNYLTITELAFFIPADVSWIRKLEAQDRIPKARRVPMGKLEVRLWSPKQAEEIKAIIEGHKIGRPAES